MVDLFSNSKIFNQISNKQISHILNFFSRKTIKKSQMLYSAGHESKYIYLILSGEFSISTNIKQKEASKIYRATPGTLLGETSFLAQTKHSSYVKALLDSEVLRIKDAQMRLLIHKYPQLAINLGFIEAERLRNRFSENDEVLPKEKFIVHFSSGDPIESHYIGINLASSMAKALGKNIAYLHLSHCNVTPIETLKLQVNENHLLKAIDNLRNYSRIKLKEIMITHKSGLSFLPSMAGVLPINMLTTKDLPKLLGLLGKEYPIVFMELGSEKLHSRKTIQIIKQADKIMLGVSGHKKSLHEVSKLLNTFREKVKEVSCKIFIYENQIRILEKRKNLTDLQKKVYSKTEIEKKLSHPLDFFLDGPLQTIESYAGEQLLIHRENSGRAAVKMRSLGRWLVNKSRGLSLGGGGARAISEIGVLRAMEKKDIHFDAISGTSMGALIGALYAAGYNSYEIEKKFKEILPNDSVFTDYTLPFLSFFRGKKLDKLLKRVFGKLKFEDLSIPFYCVAADLLSGKEVVFDSGYLWLAIRASMSLPVIFPPVRYKNYYLIDGGALNNIPGSILKSQRVNKVIGVNCTPFEDDSIARYFKETNLFNLLKPKRGFLKNMFLFLKNIRNFIRRPPILQIANRSMMIEGAELTKSKAHIFDVLLHPDVKDFGLFDFQRREELIRCGEKAAENHLKGNKK